MSPTPAILAIGGIVAVFLTSAVLIANRNNAEEDAADECSDFDEGFGRAPSGQALVSDHARAGRGPTGFDPSRNAIYAAGRLTGTPQRNERD